jgi:hypothetical protein
LQEESAPSELLEESEALALALALGTSAVSALDPRLRQGRFFALELFERLELLQLELPEVLELLVPADLPLSSALATASAAFLFPRPWPRPRPRLAPTLLLAARAFSISSPAGPRPELRFAARARMLHSIVERGGDSNEELTRAELPRSGVSTIKCRLKVRLQ